MATRLDQKIQQLQDLVERHLNLCPATSNGGRCILPESHPPATPHKFTVQESAARRLIEEICNGGWVIGGPA